MIRRALWVLLAAVLCAVPAQAQEQRGAIDGVVRDNSGAILPGATVEARNVAQGAVLSQVTDSEGNFRFPSVSPGSYEVTVNLQGFAAQKQNVEVVLGSIKTLNFQLGVGGVAESVQVTAETPVVDVRSSGKSTNITQQRIDALPKGRDFTSVVVQAPGANQEARSGGISIDGASASENRWIIDGAESTDLRNGTSGKILVTDFVEEVQVKSSGYTPEYGGSTGGVINVTSRTGTNAFHGSLLTYYENSNMNGDVRDTLRLNPSNTAQSEYIQYDRDDQKTWYPGFTIGGPMMRDKVWFFAGYNPTLQNTERTVTFRSTNTTNSFEQEFSRQNGTANVTAQPWNNLRLKGAINYSPGDTSGVLPAIDGSGNPLADYSTGRETPNTTYSGNVDYVVTNNFLVGARGGYYTSDVQDKGIFQGTRYLFQNSNIGQAGVPASLQRANGFSNVPSNTESTFDIRTRTNAQVDASYFFNAAGSHSLKAGVQFDRIANEVQSGETGNLVRIQWNRALSGQRGEFGYYQVRSNGAVPRRGFLTQGDISQTNVGFFIQDAWTVSNRLTINYGVRTENEKVPSYSLDPAIPPVGIEFGYGEKLAPRIGASYDVTGDGRNKIYGSWGVFYDIMKLELPRGSFGGDKWLEYYYTLDTADWTTLNDNPACPPACPGTLLRGPIDFRHPSNDPTDSAVDPDLKPFKQQEAVVGYERQLASLMALSFRYVHKQVDRAIEDVGALDANQNEIYTITNPGFGRGATFFPAGSNTSLPFPKAIRDYDAFEVVFNKRYADRWALVANYTLSRLYGNYSGLSQSDEAGRTSPNVGRNFDYPVMAFDQNGEVVVGRLGTDRPHQFKAQLVYSLPFGTDIGLNQFMSSGVPVSREVAVVAPNNFPVQYLGRNSDGRTDMLMQTDLQLMHRFRFGGARSVDLILNVLNLFDQDAVTDVFKTTLQSGQGIDINEEEFYSGFDADALIAQQGLVRDPRFLQPSAFQAPRELRIGVRFSF